MAKRNPYAVLVEAGIPEARAARLIALVAELSDASWTEPDEPFSDSEMVAMADIGPEDLEDARTDWYLSTEPAYARLLDAREL